MLLQLSTLVIWLALANLGSAYYVTVDAYDEECFYEKVPSGTQMTLSFEVAEGGFLDIDMTIYAPNGEPMHIAHRESTGRFAFAASQEGEYTYCFSNRMSSVTPKTVMFDMQVVLPSGTSTDKNSDQETLDHLVDQLYNDLSSISSEQHHMEVRDRVHSQISESTNQRVVYWSVFEALLLIGMTVGQVIYLKRFFEVRRVV